MTEYIVSRLFLGVGDICLEQERQVEEHFFTFTCQYRMFFPILFAIAFVPIKASKLTQVNHECILP